MKDILKEGPVTVCANEEGLVVCPTRNPAMSYIRVEQLVPTLKEDAWFRNKKRSCLIMGFTDDLQGLNVVAGDTLGGRLVVLESLTPPNPKDGTRDMKIAGESGVVCRVGDEPIYRTVFYDPTGQKEDTFIQHDNGDEIRAAQMIGRLDFSKVGTMGTVDNPILPS